MARKLVQTSGTLVVNKRGLALDPQTDVYIGRPSKWGNPFSHREGTLAKFKVDTIMDAVLSYRDWIQTQPELMAAIPELMGKRLLCFCKPQLCHGDVLVRLCNRFSHEESPESTPDPNRLQTILVCGSREWKDKDAIRHELVARLSDVDMLIHGAAKGADSLAGEVARELGVYVREFPADWDRYRPTDETKGNPAGHIRNAQMLKQGQPDLVLAFGEGRGTDGMVKLAEKAGLPVVRIAR